ncbi:MULTISPECIES: T3SS effector HopA1 family protein [Streptomyces]|uniref:T3SS effector HopA1 family protein n=1 Tax=Streptomyces TaxID=1883 RepID=UPI000ABEC905|nr:T3SS effector HopA1 family protein [Streptomyces sp. NRRL S-15]
MSRYDAVFASMAEDIEVLDQATFRHREWGDLSPAAGVETEPGTLPVLAHLWRFLYLSYYAGDARAARWLIDGAPVVLGTTRREDPEVGALLSAANQAVGYPEPGWVVTGRADGSVTVLKDGVTLTATEEQIVPSQEGTSLSPGQQVSVVMPSGRPYLYPGWYLAVSDHGMPSHGELPVVRLYFAPRDPRSGATLLRSLTGLLCGLGVPYQIKSANNPEGYERCDPLVLYVYRHDWERHRAALAAVHRDHESRLRDAGPCFALELARGWWIADEPDQYGGRLMSFGQHRCLLAAEGLVTAWQEGRTGTAGRLGAIRERYRAEGIEPARPYLNARPSTSI